MDIAGLVAELDQRLVRADAALKEQFPGERPGRQPVHTLYVPADRFDAGTMRSSGRAAEMTVLEHGGLLLEVLDGDDDLLDRVLRKVSEEPIEDLRIDFEDGYGARPDSEEDGAARSAATALRQALDDGTASAFQGIRFKSLDPGTRARGVRTLALFLETLGEVPQGFVVTLPKVTSVDQVEAMVLVAERLEPTPGALRFELQIETPQSILGPDGTALVARMIHASQGRCTALHYGTYDYSAFCGIAAPHQSLEHPVADHAKAVMQAAAAGTGVRLSDGSTNVLPVGDPDTIRAAWTLHLRLVRRALERGYYQGWDLHPAQLPTRYAATFAFYRDGLAAAGDRLRRYDGTGSGTQEGTGSGTVLDEPATARALADFLVRGYECGALTGTEVGGATGMGMRDLANLAQRALRDAP